MDLPGAYQYKVEYGKKITFNIGYFIAEPRIKLPKSKSNELLPLDGIMILSMVPKWMGPITEWGNLIEETEYAGYNMIHFVPLQKRGISNSPYSISDQLSFDNDVFNETDRKKSNKQKLAIVESAIAKLHSKRGILSLSDVVWNHTSDSSEFLLQHPEAGNITKSKSKHHLITYIGYNLHNSPYLVPAYELDTALIDLSGNMESVGLPRDIHSDQDADSIINYIKNNTFKDLKLYEYKVIDVDKHVNQVREALLSRSVSCDPSAYKLDSLQVKERVALFGTEVVRDGHLGTRFHKSVDLTNAISFLLAFNHIPALDQVSDDRVDALAQSFQGLLNDYNMPLYEEYDEECRVALDNIKGRLLFTRLAENGPKLGTITKRYT